MRVEVQRTYLRVDNCSKRFKCFKPSYFCLHALIDDNTLYHTDNTSSLNLEKNLPNFSDNFVKKMADPQLELSKGVFVMLFELEINATGDNYRKNDVDLSISKLFRQIALSSIRKINSRGNLS